MADDSRHSLLATLAEAYDEAIANGDTRGDAVDESVPLELLPELRDMQVCLRALHDACREGLISADHDASKGSRPHRTTAPRELPRTVGRFEIVRELGRGGYGIVFEAIDPHLNRTVALKVPRPDALASDELRDRFLREAEAAGVLEHPNLVPVYEVGQDGPICYIASAYCHGPTLASWLMHNQQASAREAAQLVAAVADGVAEAHQHCVLHRDIKPSNVLLDTVIGARASARGDTATSLEEFTPRLTDFGLAKLLERNDDRTRTGTLLGTPAYMAPEQAEGRTRAIGPTTDVYALGVLLYELLTGRPPFRGENDADTLRQVSVGEPLPPSRLRPRLPRDLEAICLKCLEHSQARRYPSAADLATDLHRYLDGQPTEARPVGPLGRTWKWSRRHPAAAGLVAVSLWALIAISIGGWWMTARESTVRREAERQQQLAESHAEELRHILYASNMMLTQRELNADHTEQAVERLKKSVPRPGETDLREFAWRYLWAASHEQQCTLEGHQGEVYNVAWSPDGTVLASCGSDSKIFLWDLARRSHFSTLVGHKGDVNSLAFSPDGDLIASAGDDGTVRLWSWRESQEPTVLNDPGEKSARMISVAFSPDGRLLATGGANSVVQLWRTDTFELQTTLRGHQNDIEYLTFSPDGKVLASGSYDHTVRLWRCGNWQVIRSIEVDGPASRLVFTRNSQQLLIAATAEIMTIYLCDVADNESTPRVVWTQYEGARGMALCDHDAVLAIDNPGGSIHLINLATGKPFRVLRGHTQRVWSVTSSPDGNLIATSGRDKTIRVWDIDRTASHLEIAEDRLASCFALSHDNRTIAIGGDGFSVDIFDVASLRKVKTFAKHATLVGDFDGDRCTDNGTYRRGRWTLDLSTEPGEVDRDFVFGWADAIPLVGDWDGDGTDNIGVFKEGRWWLQVDDDDPGFDRQFTFGEANTAPVVGDWNGDGRDDVAVYLDGSWQLRVPPESASDSDEESTIVRLQLGSPQTTAIVRDWDRDGRDDIGVLNVSDRIEIDLGLTGNPAEASGRLSWSKDRRLASLEMVPTAKTVSSIQPVFSDLRLTAAEVDAGRDRSVMRRSGVGISSLAFSADDSQIAYTCSADRYTYLCRATDGELIKRLEGVVTPAEIVAFSPDGNLLAFSGLGNLQLWDCKSYSSLSTFRDIAPHRFIAFSPLSELASAGQDGNINFWNKGATDPLFSLSDSTQGIRAIAFSHNSKLLASASEDRVVRLWDLSSRRQIGKMIGHTQAINRLAFSADDKTLASGSADQTVRLWDLYTRQQLAQMDLAYGRVIDLRFSDDGEFLAAVGGSTTKSELHIWRAVQK